MDLIPRKFFLDDFFEDFRDVKNNMKCDIYEKDGKYFIEVDIPGYKKEDINIDCEKGYLTITATHEEENGNEEKNYIRKERYYGKNVRQFYVGDVNEENIKAEFSHGTLKITVPKKEEIVSKKKIEIEG